MPDDIKWGHVATIACVRAGGDLEVVVNREQVADEHWKPIEGGRWRFVIHAFDTDGNPVIQLGVFLDEQAALAMVPTCVMLAREARGPGHFDDFDMVKWTMLDEDKGTVEWAGARPDDDLCPTIGH